MKSNLSTDSYWWEAAPLEEPAELALPGDCDVAVVGAGFAGRSGLR